MTSCQSQFPQLLSERTAAERRKTVCERHGFIGLIQFIDNAKPILRLNAKLQLCILGDNISGINHVISMVRKYGRCPK